MSVQCQVLRCS